VVLQTRQPPGNRLDARIREALLPDVLRPRRRSVSGQGDSIREWRARKVWDKAEREETATQTKSLALLVVTRFEDSREQIAVLEKVLLGRLDLGYLSWNGRTR